MGGGPLKMTVSYTAALSALSWEGRENNMLLRGENGSYHCQWPLYTQNHLSIRNCQMMIADYYDCCYYKISNSKIVFIKFNERNFTLNPLKYLSELMTSINNFASVRCEFFGHGFNVKNMKV